MCKGKLEFYEPRVFMESRYGAFKDFYPFYLNEHANRNSWRLHFIGTSIGLVVFIAGVVMQNGRWLLAAFVSGYAFAFSGHYLFEKNHPATFKYPAGPADALVFSGYCIGRAEFVRIGNPECPCEGGTSYDAQADIIRLRA